MKFTTYKIYIHSKDGNVVINLKLVEANLLIAIFFIFRRKWMYRTIFLARIVTHN